ncbi:MAG: hypothetical protein JWQ74_3020 [Marmoricola sp.]|nr:hypothetical protein [Marmoricola sp.]
MKANRLTLAAVAGVSVLALTGCAPTGDVAAKIGGATIRSTDVDFLAGVYCAESNKAAAGGTSQAQPVTKQAVRASMLTMLLETQIESQLGRAAQVPVDQASVTQQLAQYEGTFAATSAADQKRYLALFRKLYEARTQFQALVNAQAAAAGAGDKPSDEQLQAIAAQDFSTFVAKKHVEIDPVYGVDKKLVGNIDPSLSVALSSFSKKATAAQPDTAWVGALPKNQRCG